jgi:hypothetical protein
VFVVTLVAGSRISAQELSQRSGGGAGANETGDAFGSALTWASFTGSETLVVGAPSEDVGSLRDAGAAYLLQTFGHARVVTQNSPGMAGRAEAGDRFGAALTPITTFWDRIVVAIGVPGEDVGAARNAGMVNFLLAPSERRPLQPLSWLLTQNTPAVPDVAESGDHFGSVLGTRYVGTDVQLLVGIPDEDIRGRSNSGALAMVTIDPYQHPMKFPTTLVSQLSRSVGGGLEAGDHFGAAVATLASDPADDEDGVQSMYLGAPGEDAGHVLQAGLVWPLSARLEPYRAGSRFGAALG